MTEQRDWNTGSESKRDSPESRPVADGGDRGANRQPRDQQGDNQPRGRQPQGGQPQRGRQGRGQPQRGQPQGGQSSQQTRPQGGRPPQNGGRPQGQPPGDDGSRFTRRQLLAGGGAAVAAGAGGWFFFLRGPGGAKGIVDDYVAALGDNDWAAAEALFHEQSPVSRQISERDDINSFEDLLRNGGVLERAESLEPSVDSHTEYSHYPDYTEETANQIAFSGPTSEQAGSIDALKRILTVYEVDASTWFGEGNERADQLAGDTTKVRDISSVVSDGGDWSLWGNSVL